MKTNIKTIIFDNNKIIVYLQNGKLIFYSLMQLWDYLFNKDVY